MVLEKAIKLLNKGDAQGFADQVTEVMKSLSNPEYAKLCNHLKIKNPIGVKRSVVKKMADEIVKKVHCDRELFLKGGKRLWRTGISENRRLAIFILSFLIQRDADFTLYLSSKFVKKAAGNCDSWELADDFGMNVLGLILARDIYQLDEIRTWVTDANMWLKRTIAVSAWGLYMHSKKKGDNRVDSALELLDSLMECPEEVKFGLMWPLRMLCKYESKACTQYIKKWLGGDETSRWIVNTALKKVPLDRQLHLLSTQDFSFERVVDYD